MANIANSLIFFSVAVLLPADSFASSPSGLPDYVTYPQTQLSRHKPHILAAALEFDPLKCTLVSSGTFVISTQPKYGTVTVGTTTLTLNGLYCNGMTFPAADLIYTWTADNNKADTDYIFSQWKTADYSENFTSRPNVPIVRPVGETTRFVGWQDTRGLWMQRLIPPSDEPNFDFTGETIMEVGTGDTDLCYDGKFPLGQARLTPHTWTVTNKVEWGPDGVGWGTNDNSYGQCAIEYYRCVKRTTCGAGLKQQMMISSPADNGNFVKYGSVNALTFFVTGGTQIAKSGYGQISSSRADGGAQWQYWPSGPLSCPNFVKLPC